MRLAGSLICEEFMPLPHPRLCALLTDASLFRIRIGNILPCSENRHKSTIDSQMLPEDLVKLPLYICTIQDCAIAPLLLTFFVLHLIIIILRISLYFRSTSTPALSAHIPSLVPTCYAESTRIANIPTATTSALRNAQHISQYGGANGLSL